MRRALLIVACLAALTVAGCGSTSGSGSASASASSTASAAQSSSVHFAKTKFLLHAGLAFGAFHRYVDKPFKQGDFSYPFTHKLTLVKAGAAALFIKHELTLAAEDVHSSRTLSTLFSPLTAAAQRIDSLKDSIVHGSVSGADLDGVQSSLSSIGQTAASKGQSIKDLVPSAGQLAGG